MRIGIDLGGTKTEGIAMNDHGDILHRLRRPTPQAEGYDAILNNIQVIINELEKMARCRCSIGIGTPGSLSPQSGLLRNSNTVCMNGKPLKTDLETLTGREIRIANDANCFTLSESIDGAAAGASPVFGIIIGTGTGGGIVVKGNVIHGVQHIAGEWGHNPLLDEGRPCYCGRQDCVETYLSGQGLVTTWKGLGGQGKHSARDIAHQAALGDKISHLALTVYYQHFARALAYVINILDPQIIVLGGGLSNIDTLYRQLYSHLKPQVFSDVLRTRIVKNLHGDSSGVRGAAWLWDR